MAILTPSKLDPNASHESSVNGLRGQFSADVKMVLTVGDREFAIGQMGSDLLILRDPVDLPPCNAWILLRIDGSVERWEVSLPDGVRAADREVRIAPPV